MIDWNGFEKNDSIHYQRMSWKKYVIFGEKKNMEKYVVIIRK